MLTVILTTLVLCSPQGKGAPDKDKVLPLVSLKVRRQVIAKLQALMPKRARYHVHKRSLILHGEFDRALIATSVLKVLEDSPSQRAASIALWRYWQEISKTEEAKVVRSEVGFSVDWDPSLTLKTYDQPTSKSKTPWPIAAELSRYNFDLRLCRFKNGNSTVHVTHHLSSTDDTPRTLLMPLPSMIRSNRETIANSGWTLDTSNGWLRYRIREKKFSGRSITGEIVLDPANRLPRALLWNGSRASLFTWRKTDKETMWIDSVIQIRSRPGRIRVDWIRVEKVIWNPKKPIQITWPLPTKLLDTRLSRNRLGAFDIHKLPHSLQSLRWPALTAKPKK